MTDNLAAETPATRVRRDLTIDQRLALKTAATHLQTEFADMFGVETIERFLYSSYDQFGRHASIANFLPLLAERFARQRLRALAELEGKQHDGKPIVLFLCTHNAGRSQMAMGFFTHLAGDAADVVITMGCGDACPVFPGRRDEEWVLDDPAGQDVEAIRPIRDDIEERVRRLLTELKVPANA